VTDSPIVRLAGEAAEPLTLALMLAAFGLLLLRARWPLGVALVTAAWAGAAVNGDVLPVRHLVEGASSYLDAILVIATAMMFMRALADAGALAAIAWSVRRRFGHAPSVLLPLVMLIVMFPGMMTGSSTASVLTTGAMASSVLGGLGLAPARAAAFVAMGGVLGMVAPPINIPAMIIGGGIDLPYVGFAAPLALGAFPLAAVLAYALGAPLFRGARAPASVPASDSGHRRAAARPGQVEAVAGDEPPEPLWRAAVPIAALAAMMLAPVAWPRRVPDPGLPATFAASALVVWATRPRLRITESFTRAIDEALPVLGILAGVGAFIQVMTLTGARGWLVSQMLTAPPWAIVPAAALGMPLFGAVSAFGSASVLGVPFLLASIGRNEIVTAAALSMLAGVGDLMLPASLAATLAARAAGLPDRRPVLRLCVLPAIALVLVAVAMLVAAPTVGRWLP
jgi:TRAP-type C4-dicarboxylate transport system permease large subunit